MIDPSYLQTVKVFLRPFTEDFDENWLLVKYTAMGFFCATAVMWLLTFMISNPVYAKPKQILNAIGWLTFVFFIFSYAACCYRVMLNDRELEKLKQDRITNFD